MVTGSNILRGDSYGQKRSQGCLGSSHKPKGQRLLGWLGCWVQRFLAKADPFTGINKPGVGLVLKTWSMAYGENYNRV